VLGGLSLVALAGLPLLITAAAGAIATFIALNWGAIKTGFDTVRAAISGFIDWIATIPSRVKDFFSGFGKDAPQQVYPGGTLRQKNSFFDPGTRPQKSQPISLSLSIDGRTLAEVMSEKLDDLLRYDTSAPAFNGAGRYGA
jgi:hypothetical protein